MQAAFTAKELREILNMEGITVSIDSADMKLTDLDQKELKSSRVRKRVYDLLEKASLPDAER